MARNGHTISQDDSFVPAVEPTLNHVRYNAVKHGILSTSPVIPIFEREVDWRRYREAIFAEIAPEGGLMEALTERIATLLWRLMRVVRFEREVVHTHIMNTRRDIDAADGVPGEERELTIDLKQRMQRVAMTRIVPEDNPLNKIIRYEARLHRQLLQTVRLVKQLQSKGN